MIERGNLKLSFLLATFVIVTNVYPEDKEGEKGYFRVHVLADE